MTQQFSPGDICRFTKSGSIVRVVKAMGEGYEVARIDTNKQMYATVDGLARLVCVGFGEFDGKCTNDAGSTHSDHWCQRCDDLRKTHITSQLQKLLAVQPC